MAFFVIASAGAQTRKEVHKGCTTCHSEEDYAVIKTKIDETCLKCHINRKGKDHPIGVVSTIIPDKLPLSEGNKITCITCHEPHSKETVDKLLRMDPNKICISCHKDLA